MERVIRKELSFTELTVRVNNLGKDVLIVIEGGTRPHIGSTVLAVPRPSLTGDGSVSVTSSVINVTGHKDEELCRILAESAAKRQNAVVVCTGGFHADNISMEQIAELKAAVKEIAAVIGEVCGNA